MAAMCGLRYNQPANKPIAAAVLSDTADLPTALYLANDEDERLTEQWEELIAGSQLANWRWNIGEVMPDLPLLSNG